MGFKVGFSYKIRKIASYIKEPVGGASLHRGLERGPLRALFPCRESVGPASVPFLYEAII
jgi:hypothetical protein